MAVDRTQRKILDNQVLAQLSALPLHSRKPMLGNVSGRHSSPHRGSSVEFAEYRKYVPGDDLRRLDWRAFGRTDRYYIKEFEADTNLRMVLVVDTSGSMEFGSSGSSKLEYAQRLAATLAYLAIQQGDAVGLAQVSESMSSFIPARRNPAHLTTLLDQIELAKPQGETGLVEVLHELAEVTRQRALIVILSDLFVEPAALKSCFEHLRFRKHDVAAFHLLDPEELQFAFQRPTRFVDTEGGPAIFADPIEIADRYHRALEQYLLDLNRAVIDAAVDYHRVDVSQNYAEVLKKFLIGRAYRSRAR